MCTNIMFASVEEQLLFRFLEKAMPTWEKRRSTEADDAGQPTHQLLRYGASPRLGTWLWVLDVKVSIPPPWTCLGDPRQPQNSSQYARWSPQPSRRDLADGSKSARFGDVVPSVRDEKNFILRFFIKILHFSWKTYESFKFFMKTLNLV